MAGSATASATGPPRGSRAVSASRAAPMRSATPAQSNTPRGWAISRTRAPAADCSRTWPRPWLAGKVDLAPRTRANVVSRLERHILPRFGARPIAAIRPEEVRAFVKHLSEERGLSPAAVKSTYLTLGQVFSMAEVDRIIPRSACIGITLPRVAGRREMLFLTTDQIEALADAIEPRYRALIILGGYTGLRAAELEGLRLERVDLLRRRLQVVETLYEVGGALMTGPTKTYETRGADAELGSRGGRGPPPLADAPVTDRSAASMFIHI